MLVDRSGGKSWFYWIAPLLAIGFARVMFNLVVAVLDEGRAARDEGSPAEVTARAARPTCRAPDPGRLGDRPRGRPLRRRSRSARRTRISPRRCRPTSTRSPSTPRRSSPTTPACARRATSTRARARPPRLGRLEHRVDAHAARSVDADGSATRLARNPFAPVGRQVAAGELGALLGYMSQRVLGQYDLLVPDDPRRRRGLLRRREHPRRSRSGSRSGRATSGCGSRSTR